MANHRRLGICRSGLAGVALVLAARAAGAQSSMPEAPPPVEPWYEAVQLRAFADGYVGANWAFPKPTRYQPPTRSFDGPQGFALSWIGLDATFAPEPVVGTLNLRFAPTATLHAGEDAGSGLEYVKQAFVAWRPGSGSLTLELGKFDTFVGVEAAESQDNFNYTRGLLFSFAQPLFHTGVRATADLVDGLTLTAMVANGLNRSFDNNVGKTFGLGLSVNPSDAFAASLSWLGGPEQPDSTEVACSSGTAYDPEVGSCAAKAGAPAQTQVVDRGGANDFNAWRHLVDFSLRLQPMESLAVVLNADYGVEGVRPADTSIEAEPKAEKWYGAALLTRMQLSETWAVALRGEYLADPDGRALAFTRPDGAALTDTALGSATLTIEARPTDNLILRLDSRGDFVLDAAPDKEIFREKVRGSSDKLFTTTLGVVVTTN